VTPFGSRDEESVAQARERVAGAARDLLAGRIDLVEAARRILAWQLRADDRDAAFLVFAGINEETKTLPSESERDNWWPDALALRDADRRIYEERHGDAAREAARRLVHRYSPKPATTDVLKE
jgi:hypothetical protein